MAREHSKIHEEIDLDKTDRLPILEGTLFDHDVTDDAEPLDHAGGSSTAVLPVIPADFVRPSGVDLPSLAESVRSVEERIARQSAEFEALTRSYERVRDAEAAAAARAAALAEDLGAARTALESEQVRAREIDKSLTEKTSAVEAARSRAEEALRESERHQGESRTLRESLATRDSTIARVLHSLGERDAQLTALQQEHAKIVPALEARSQLSDKLGSELQTSRAQASALGAELKSSRDSTAALDARLKRVEGELAGSQSELAVANTQANSYLEQLRTRDWRRGFDHNMFRELDAQVGAVQASESTLKAERDRLQDQVANLELKVGAQDKAIEKLQSAAVTHATTFSKQAHDLKHAEQTRVELTEKLSSVEKERVRLSADLATRERSLAEARATGSADAKQVAELVAAAAQRIAQHDAQIAQLQTEHAAQTSQLQSEHSAQVAQMQAQHAAQVAQMQGEHESQMSLIQTTQATQLSELGAEHESEVSQLRTELSAQIAELQGEAKSRNEEMSVLTAHLTEARRPIQLVEAEVKRVSDELAAKSASFDQLTEDHRKLQTALERTRGALEEREFLIRRLERSESNNANVLGRIQTSIERLGSASPGATATPITELAAELVRVDGEKTISHTLGRRTRIGRSAGCELQIEASSVSRHHALLLVGPRDAIIEDLNSTNGVIVNGRKVTRQLLNDGDAVTIGDIQFRFVAKSAPRTAEPHPAEPATGSTPSA